MESENESITYHWVCAVDVEVGNELDEQRLRSRQVFGSWWRYNNESIREIELVIRIEDRLWRNVIGVGVGDTQSGNVIELLTRISMYRRWVWQPTVNIKSPYIPQLLGVADAVEETEVEVFKVLVGYDEMSVVELDAVSDDVFFEDDPVK